MKLTKRERILLPTVLIIILSALFINFVYLPLSKELSVLIAESLTLKLEVEAAQQRAAELEVMKQQVAELTEEMEANNPDLLRIWDQAELLASIESMVSKVSDQNTIDFYDVTSLNFLKVGVVGITFETNNANLKKLLKNLESAEYFNTQSKYSVTKIPEPESQYDLNVSMDLQFYALPMETEYPEKYDFMKGSFGKTDIYE